jgi:hypothetical protein
MLYILQALEAEALARGINLGFLDQKPECRKKVSTFKAVLWG